MARWRELRSLGVLLSLVVPKPLLTGLEAAHNRMARRRRMMRRMLGRRAVAAADMTALCATAEVQPPARPAACLAVCASSSARYGLRIHSAHAHKLSASSTVSPAAGSASSRSSGIGTPLRTERPNVPRSSRSTARSSFANRSRSPAATASSTPSAVNGCARSEVVSSWFSLTRSRWLSTSPSRSKSCTSARSARSRSRATVSSTLDPFPLSLEPQCEPSRAYSRAGAATRSPDARHGHCGWMGARPGRRARCRYPSLMSKAGTRPARHRGFLRWSDFSGSPSPSHPCRTPAASVTPVTPSPPTCPATAKGSVRSFVVRLVAHHKVSDRPHSRSVCSAVVVIDWPLDLSQKVGFGDVVRAIEVDLA